MKNSFLKFENSQKYIACVFQKKFGENCEQICNWISFKHPPYCHSKTRNTIHILHTQKHATRQLLMSWFGYWKLSCETGVISQRNEIIFNWIHWTYISTQKILLHLSVFFPNGTVPLPHLSIAIDGFGLHSILIWIFKESQRFSIDRPFFGSAVVLWRSFLDVVVREILQGNRSGK